MANAAKYFAAEAGFKAAEQAVLTLGGMGYAQEYHVARLLREAWIPRLAPVSAQPGNPAFTPDVPYIYAIIQLDEGPRMNGNVNGIDIEDVEIDMQVEVYFEERGDQMIPQWKPVGAPDPS